MLGLFQNIFHPLGAFLEEHGVPAHVYDEDIKLGDELYCSFLDACCGANVGRLKGGEFEAFVALLRQGYSLSNPVTPSSSSLGSLPTLSAQLFSLVEGIDLICFGLYFFVRGMRLDSPEKVSDYGQRFGNWRHEQVGFLRGYEDFADVPDLMREAATLLHEVKYKKLSDEARAFRCQAIGQKIERATQSLRELHELFVLVGDNSQEMTERHPILIAAREKLPCFSIRGSNTRGSNTHVRGDIVLPACDAVLSDIDYLLEGCDKQRQTLRQLQGETQAASVRADVQALTTVGVLSSAPSQPASTCRRRHVASGSADSVPPTQRISVR